MHTAQAVQRLRLFIKRLVKDGVTNSAQFKAWKKEEKNATFMAECLDYNQLAGMPQASALVKPFFHPEMPFIGLNYTPVAHNTLHAFPTGWTMPIQHCRGIVFHRDGRLLAFPYPKFFNWGESHGGSKLPTEGRFEATVKHDGHLGIIFEFEGVIYITTRGSFESKTSKLATAMLDAYRAAWKDSYPANVTTLVEVIHPETYVHVDYSGEESFIVIGAYNRRSFKDQAYSGIRSLAQTLGLKVTARWKGKNLADLVALMHDHSVHNQEGFVVRGPNGEREKFKFKTYIAKMVEDKLDTKWVMARIKTGSIERSNDLPGEVLIEIQRLRGLVMTAKDLEGDRKSRIKYLFELEPLEEKRSPYYKTLCSKFITWLDAGAQVETESEETEAA